MHRPVPAAILLSSRLTSLLSAEVPVYVDAVDAVEGIEGNATPHREPTPCAW